MVKHADGSFTWDQTNPVNPQTCRICDAVLTQDERVVFYALRDDSPDNFEIRVHLAHLECVKTRGFVPAPADKPDNLWRHPGVEVSV